MGPSTEVGLVGRSRKRRSGRLKLRIPLVISGVDGLGVRFEVLGETVTVSKYGAKVRVSSIPPELCSGMEVRLKIRSTPRSQFVRLVWVGRKADEFGVELQRPENFWNVFFPPCEEDEPPAGMQVPASLPQPETTPPFPPQDAGYRESEFEAPSPAPLPPAFVPIRCPAEGMEVLVTGMSAVQSPFQEKVRMVPVRQDEARLFVKKLVDTGRIVRLITFSDSQTLKGRIVGISELRQRGKWIVVVRFPHPVFCLD